MKRLFIMLALSCVSHADPIKIAVIDTGFDMTWATKQDDIRFKNPLPAGPAGGTVPVNICPGGTYDFVNNKGDGHVKESEMKDEHGHGTHIAGLIAKFAATQDYCVVVMKYYDSNGADMLNLVNTVSAFRTAIRLKVDVINYSGGGIAPSPEEREQVLAALDAGIIVVAAAGNNRSDVNFRKYYPAGYDSRIVMVGSIYPSGHFLPSSNYSDNKPGHARVEKELGNDIFSILPGGQYGYMTGTSQATAIMTGGIVNRLSMMRKDKYMQIINDRKMPLQSIKAPTKCMVPKAYYEESTHVTCTREPLRVGK